MADRAIVFAMANPTPEVDPEAIEGLAEVIATGRSDYPNQINNVLAFPGVFRGALDVRARTINGEMELAAARAIAQTIGDDELSADYIVPSVFNRAVAPAVAAAVAEAAEATGVARRALHAHRGGSRMIDIAHREQHAARAPFESATVEDAMSPGVISCPPETPLRVVARMMATFNVHSVFVFEHRDEDDEDAQFWGVVSDLDLVAAGPAERRRAHRRCKRGDADRCRSHRCAARPCGRPDGAARRRAPRRGRAGERTADRRHLDARHRPRDRRRARPARDVGLGVTTELV